MRRRYLEKLVAGISAITLSASHNHTFIESKKNENISTVNSDATVVVDSDINIRANRGELFLKETTTLLLEKQEQERLKALEEERTRLEEEARIKAEEERIKAEEEALRIAEINRKNNVSVNLDNVLEPSNITAEELYEVLIFMNKPEMAELSFAIIDAETHTGVNSLFLTGLIANESSWNTSYKANTMNNVTGFASYSSNHSGAYFNSKYECIIQTAEWLKSAYLSPEGQYFVGYSTWAINQHYCLKEDMLTVDNHWAATINNISKTVESIYHTYIK